MLFVLAVGAYFDLRSRRIPNWWILTGAAGGILVGLLLSVHPLSPAGAAAESGKFLFGMAFGCAVFSPLFLCRMIGAGDIKAAALIIGYLGLGAGGLAILAGLLLGAVWSLGKMVVHRNLAIRLTYFLDYVRRSLLRKAILPYYDPARDGRDVSIPLAPCFFLGVLIVILWNA